MTTDLRTAIYQRLVSELTGWLIRYWNGQRDTTFPYCTYKIITNTRDHYKDMPVLRLELFSKTTSEIETATRKLEKLQGQTIQGTNLSFYLVHRNTEFLDDIETNEIKRRQLDFTCQFFERSEV
jgi:hypothetical protein